MSKAILSRRVPIPVTMSRVVVGKGPDIAPSPDREFFVIEVLGGSPSRTPSTSALPGMVHGHRVPRDPPPRSLPFLRTCGTCGKGLSARRDIYIYKGDIAFCSQDCREERMQWDI